MLDSIINLRFAAASLAWGGAMLGVLQLRHLSGSWSHALCGPWGCGPTLESVATCHLVWLLLLAPAVLLIATRSSSEAIVLCGKMAMGAGLLGLVGVAGWVTFVWAPSVSSEQLPYAGQKFGYTVACLVDVPMVQLMIVGGILRFIGLRADGDGRDGVDRRHWLRANADS